MEKERFKIEIIDEVPIDADPICFDLYDNLKKKYFESTNDIVNVLNQQDARIKELEEALKKANTNNYLTDYYLVEKENQQFKEEIKQLKFDYAMYKSANYLINDVGIDKAREIMFQSEQQLKQSQNQKAIEVLEQVKEKFGYKYNSQLVISSNYLCDFIDSQIKELGV